jgi:hypothetical protein
MEIGEQALFSGSTVEPCASFKNKTNINGQKVKKLAPKILSKFWKPQDRRKRQQILSFSKDHRFPWAIEQDEALLFR